MAKKVSGGGRVAAPTRPADKPAKSSAKPKKYGK